MNSCTRRPHTNSKKAPAAPGFPGTASALYQYDQMGSQKSICMDFYCSRKVSVSSSLKWSTIARLATL